MPILGLSSIELFDRIIDVILRDYSVYIQTWQERVGDKVLLMVKVGRAEPIAYESYLEAYHMLCDYWQICFAKQSYKIKQK